MGLELTTDSTRLASTSYESDALPSAPSHPSYVNILNSKNEVISSCAYT